MVRSATNLDTLAAGDHHRSPPGSTGKASSYRQSFSTFNSETMEHARDNPHGTLSSMGLTNGMLTPVRDDPTNSRTTLSVSSPSNGYLQHVSQTPPALRDAGCQTVSTWTSPTKDSNEPLGQTFHQSPGRADLSLWDTSSFPNVTFHSMLDSTLINKTLANLSAVATQDTHSSSLEELSKEQLQVKVQYLESMNVTMREEMRLLDALQRTSASTQVSPSPSADQVQSQGTATATGMDITDDEEELLRQHLAEIRRLRQRLERLDVGKDPEQLLIFQSHIQQRISRQETMITNLQQQLREKEESWQREILETQHRLAREKAGRIEELQHAISQLEKSLEGQQKEVERLKVKDREHQEVIAELKANLAAGEQREEAKEEKVKALTSDKVKLQAYLSQQKQNYMQLEDNAFSMEKSITQQQSQIEDLKYQLKVCEERERRKEEEMRKVVTEKSELQADLIKRDRDFLEQEENLFKMELAKENAEKECKRLDGELEGQGREVKGLRKEIEEYRESSKCLKEIVVKREKSLQEKMQALQKLSNEKQQMEGQEVRVKELESQLDDLRAQAGEQDRLRERLASVEDHCQQLQGEKSKICESQKENEAKLQKRHKQLNHLITQYKKLEGAYVKLRYEWKEKLEMVKSQKRQIDYLHAMATCSSQEEKNSLMKELVKELVATQRQVEDLLSRLEPGAANGSSNSIPNVRVETCTPEGMSHPGSGGITTTTTITSSQCSERSYFSVGVSDGIPDSGTNSLTSNKEEDEEALPALSPLSSQPTDLSSPHPAGAQAGDTLSTGSYMSSKSSGDSASLYSILTLEHHETLRKQTGEALIILGGLEARIADRLSTLKAKPMAERLWSMEYSTLREVSMSCQNLKVCLQEVTRLVSLAMIKELPPTDSSGRFCDPVLKEENENLRHELTRLKSRSDLLDHTVKEQQGRLDANKERHKLWEASLYRQLHKTASDLEQAKENIDTSLGSLPGRPAPLRPSPMASPTKYNLDNLM